MEFIKVRDSEEIVRIKITIKYVGPCKYTYVISPGNSYNYSTADVPLKPFPHEYNIGRGRDIILIGNNNNNWSIQLMNPSDQDLNYEVFIEWYQGKEKESIYCWPKKNSRKGIVKGHIDHIVFSGICIYES
jgi:hypothetical protein